MYSNGVTGEPWLRGVQVTFDSLVPGCYTGRWPHIHFEVFPPSMTLRMRRITC
ncbi:hypothetical protein HMPREF0307_01803 [Corynebacterium sp. DNF00584]|nr:hypothetical protein HMPREF0307_01803 [Corynebacterium sp. DNF00584]